MENIIPIEEKPRTSMTNKIKLFHREDTEYIIMVLPDGRIGRTTNSITEVGSLRMILTLDEVSSLLKVSKETIYKMVQKGELPGAFKIGNQWRFNKTKIDSWLEELSNIKESDKQQVENNMEDDNGICEA